MSSTGLPESFDPTIIARDSFVGSADVPVSDFPRLADLLTSSNAVVQVALKASLSADQRPTMTIGLAATLEQSCQRCLQPVSVVIDHMHTVEWVADEAELARLDASEEDSDNPDWEFLPMPVPPKVLTLELVEDELILSLPIVPLHEACDLPEAKPQSTEDHPFAALARLKGLN
ncbi:MAG: YceD family protein [Fluviibacter sp.]